MSFLYAALGVYLVGQVGLAFVGLVRARREDIPAVVTALSLWWRCRDDAISRSLTCSQPVGQQEAREQCNGPG